MACTRTFIFFLLTLLILWPVLVDGGSVFHFQGKDFISYESSLDDVGQDENMHSLNNRFDIRFKTIHPSGILLFAEGTQEDLISIVLLHCKLRVVIQKSFDKLQVLRGNNLCDGKWHFVKITRNGNRVYINLDYQKRSYKIPGEIERLDLNLHTFVAGIDKTMIKQSNKNQEVIQVPNYKGCLRGVLLNQTNFLHDASMKNKHFKIHGSFKKGCSGKVLEGLIGFNRDSYLEIPAPAKRDLLIRFHFRTYYERGLLFYSQSTLFVKLSLVSGQLEFEPYISENKKRKNFHFNLGSNLADGNWHSVKLYVNSDGFSLCLDEKKIQWAKPKHLKSAKLVSFKTIVFGSGVGPKSFIGCINQLKINSHFMNTHIVKQFRQSGLHLRSCPFKNYCFPNPCSNGGKCINEGKHFICDCTGVFYTGNLCTNPLYRSSCQEYTKLGLSRDSVCSILPDKQIAPTPFKVLCKVFKSKPRIAVTVIGNMKKGWQKIDQVKAVGGYVFSDLFDYSLNFANIKAVISGSRRCQQYVAVNVSRSLLNSTDITQPHSYWLPFTTKNSEPIPIFANGYLTERTLLPVVAVKFTSDVAGSASYKIGPLRCFGTRKPSQKLSPSIDIPRLLNGLCKPLVSGFSLSSAPLEPPKRNNVFNTGAIAMESKSSSRPKTSGKPPKMAEEISSRSTSVIKLTQEAIKTRLNTEKPNYLLNNSEMEEQKQKALTEKWEVFVTAVVFAAVILLMLISCLIVTFIVKRKTNEKRTGKDAIPSKQDNPNTEMMRNSICDGHGLQPESDFWMKLNAGGYDVKTGKITYGYDIYRMT